MPSPASDGGGAATGTGAGPSHFLLLNGRDGRVTGRGACDMKGAFACYLEALHLLSARTSRATASRPPAREHKDLSRGLQLTTSETDKPGRGRVETVGPRL